MMDWYYTVSGIIGVLIIIVLILLYRDWKSEDIDDDDWYGGI